MIDLLWQIIKVAAANAGIMFIPLLFAWMIAIEVDNEAWYTKVFCFSFVGCCVILVSCGCAAATLGILTH